MGFVCFPVRKGGTDMPQLVLLCVDDRPVLLELRKTVLEQHDYSVVTATDTSSAIAILENQGLRPWSWNINPKAWTRRRSRGLSSVGFRTSLLSSCPRTPMCHSRSEERRVGKEC